MALDGTYGFVYSGANGLGVGLFTLKGEEFRGVDFGGGRYRGSAHENPDGTIDIDISFDVKPGMQLVQGTAEQEVTYRRSIKQTLPRGFGDGAPLTIISPPGTLYVMIKQVPDEWKPGVDLGISVRIGQ